MNEQRSTNNEQPSTNNHQRTTMLFKWLFTLLAIIWLYQALQPLLSPRKPPPRQAPPPPPPSNSSQQNVQKSRDDEGEYIDYEEIK